ncbi:MAG: MarR family transcriptional regulator [Methanomicrobiales archaeon]|nr:MarR family transcriptional regulator [Methanomicrobiales archaeon]
MKEREFLGKDIAFLYRYSQKNLDRELAEYGIGSGQFYAMMPLFRQDGMNQEALAQSIKVDKAQITRAVQKLVDEGYVVRKRDDEDRRSCRVFLTPKGRKTESALTAIARRWEDLLLSGISLDEREQVRSAIDTMIASVSRDLEGKNGPE